MAGDVVIRAEGLGKKYLIGHQTEARATTLREALGRSARGLARSAGAMMKGRPLVAGDAVEEFWALKDVSFEVKRGEVVGVIGRNGAGKSTLLKILSRITEPTEGRVAIKGRVASLLEVGTGFHPELTGRENIFLNGAILGMTRAEIRRKFDEIVDFAGIEKFLDTPVKRYSSGMYVRLAFAVAAHLEPEILIVDEVLAVGDAEFQKKCLGKMQDVAGHGRTVIFVSHNMAAVKRLCRKALWLKDGFISAAGDLISIIHAYQENLTVAQDGARATQLKGRGVSINSLSLCDADGVTRHSFLSSEQIIVCLELNNDRDIVASRLLVWIVDHKGDVLFVSTDEAERPASADLAGSHLIKAEIPNYIFNTGQYSLYIEVSRRDHGPILDRTAALAFSVTCVDGHGSKRGEAVWPGAIVPLLKWEHRNAAV